MRQVVIRIALALIRFYQVAVSPLTPPSCRFIPTCSDYAAQAFTTHGPLKGLGLTIWRLLRCGPWTKGGYDPVPPPDQSKITNPPTRRNRSTLEHGDHPSC